MSAWPLNSFWETFTTFIDASRVRGRVRMATRVSTGLMSSIITRMVMTVKVEFTIWLMPCCRVVATVSTSLVTRLRTSPMELRSKYPRGSRLIFSSTVFRSR